MLRSIGIAALSRQAHIIAVDLQVFAGSVRRVEHIDQLRGLPSSSWDVVFDLCCALEIAPAQLFDFRG